MNWNRILIIVGLVFLVLVLILFWWVVVRNEVQIKTTGPTDETDQVEQRPLSPAEQRSILDDLAPENPIDTPEEKQAQLDLLNNLQADPEPVALPATESATISTSSEETAPSPAVPDSQSTVDQEALLDALR